MHSVPGWLGQWPSDWVERGRAGIPRQHSVRQLCCVQRQFGGHCPLLLHAMPGERWAWVAGMQRLWLCCMHPQHTLLLVSWSAELQMSVHGHCHPQVNWFAAGAGLGACVPCPRGTGALAPRAQNCTACKLGTFGPGAGKGCFPAAPGYFVNATGGSHAASTVDISKSALTICAPPAPICCLRQHCRRGVPQGHICT